MASNSWLGLCCENLSWNSQLKWYSKNLRWNSVIPNLICSNVLIWAWVINPLTSDEQRNKMSRNQLSTLKAVQKIPFANGLALPMCTLWIIFIGGKEKMNGTRPTECYIMSLTTSHLVWGNLRANTFYVLCNGHCLSPNNAHCVWVRLRVIINTSRDLHNGPWVEMSTPPCPGPVI